MGPADLENGRNYVGPVDFKKWQEICSNCRFRMKVVGMVDLKKLQAGCDLENGRKVVGMVTLENGRTVVKMVDIENGMLLDRKIKKMMECC